MDFFLQIPMYNNSKTKEHFLKVFAMRESKLKEYILNIEEYWDEFKKKYASQIETISDILHENMFIVGFSGLYNEGLATFARKRYKRAIYYFEKALHEQPKNFNCNYNLALAYQLCENYEKAILYYEEALKIRENDTDATYNLGLCYLNIHDGELAEQYIGRALEKTPNDIGIKMSYTLALIANNQIDDAIEHTIEIVKSNKTYLDFTLDVAKDIETLCNGEEHIEEISSVIRLLNSYIKLKPNSSQAHLQNAICFKKINQLESALKHSLKAYELNPKSFAINEQTGLILYNSEKYEEALNYFEKALFLNPIKNFDTNYNIALTYEKLGRINDLKAKIEYISSHFTDHPKIGELDILKTRLEEMIIEAKTIKTEQTSETIDTTAEQSSEEPTTINDDTEQLQEETTTAQTAEE